MEQQIENSNIADVIYNIDVTEEMQTAIEESQDEQNYTEDTAVKYKIIGIEHVLSDEEKAALGEKAGILEQEIFSLENEIEQLKYSIKSNKSSLDDRSAQRRKTLLIIDAGKETRDVSAIAIYDWEGKQIDWQHPETGEVLETEPIPYQERQEALGFDNTIEKKNGNGTVRTEATSDEFKEIWYDHLRNFEFIEKPKGVTDTRLDKIKDITKSDQRYIDLIKTAGEPSNMTYYTQKSLASQFYGLSRILLEENNMIK